jgi:hypothetical protein
MLKQVAAQKENNDERILKGRSWYKQSWLIDLGLALLVTLFFARNLAANLLDKLPNSSSDIYENLWNYWQWKHLLVERHVNPFFTDYIYYPTGISLYLHTYQPLVSLQAVVTQAIFGQILGVNLVILVALTLTTWSSQQFFLYISQSRLGAWVGALIFVWCDSWYWNAVQGGNVDLISMYWIPFYLLFLFKALDAGREKRQWLFWGLALGCLVGSSFTAWYYTLHMLLLTGLIGLFYLVRRTDNWQERAKLVGKLALLGLLWLVVVSPLLINMVEQSSNRLWYVPSQSQTVLRSVDLLSFILPNQHNPLYGWLFQSAGGLYNTYNPSGVDGSFNPGYLPLLLAGLALFVGLRRKTIKYGLWVLIGLVFAVLALGPQLHFNGALLEDPKLPYWYLYNLPGLNVSRDPSRFAVPYILALAALASLATPLVYNWIVQRWSNSFNPGRVRIKPATAFSVLLVMVIGLEFAPLQVEMGIDKVPEFYRTTLAADNDEYAILEVPSHVQEGGLEHLRMYYQTFHHKKLLGGQFARDHKRLSPTDFLSHSPFFPEALLDEDVAIAPTESDFVERPRFPEMSPALLGYFDIRYIVVYPGAIKPEEKALADRFLQRALGPNPVPVYSDDTIVAYKAPPVPKEMPKVISDVGQGWFQPNSKDGQTWRWGQFGQPAEIYLENLTKAPLKVRLDFEAFSYAKPRSLRLTLNYERDLQTFQLPATAPDQPRNEKHYSLEVELKPGNNILTMFTFEQPVIPNTVSKDPDGRKLSYGIRAFKVTPL